MSKGLSRMLSFQRLPRVGQRARNYAEAFVKVLLHVCCGICAAGVAERLKSEGHELLGLFYNPNIYPREEYERRLDVSRAVARELGFPLEVPRYDPGEWERVAGHLALEPE